MWITFTEASQLITALAALGAVVASLRNSKKINDAHISINSRMDQLLKSSGEAEFAKGEEKERTKNV